MHCVPAFRIVSESMRGNQAANLGGWSCAIADRWSFQISPPLKVIQLFELCRTCFGYSALFRVGPSILVSDGFGSWHTGRVWRPPLVHRCPGLTWLGGQRTTFAGEHSLGDLFWSGAPWPIAFRWSFRCLPQWGSHVLGWHHHFYIQESGIYPKCDISSST